ncbi:unnamed protein product [Mytilus edulis]|uniref:Uncharacterized protein n=1 Tax=Mytilus edulis TaxID=6550 RepID=A0A8S3UG60_MYTED|nr:unnamed protein product [Mytilus edulis]
MDRSDCSMVAALNLGTTWSGYAFSFKSEFEKDPLTIHCNQCWNDGRVNKVSNKTPSCVLLDRNKELTTFGYDAESEFAAICLNDTFMKYKQEASGCKCDPKYCKNDCQNDKECKTKIQYIIDNTAYDLDIDKVKYNSGLRFIAKICLNNLWGHFDWRQKTRIFFSRIRSFEQYYKPEGEYRQNHISKGPFFSIHDTLKHEKRYKYGFLTTFILDNGNDLHKQELNSCTPPPFDGGEGAGEGDQ